MIARSGGVAAVDLDRQVGLEVFEPVYLIVMPVHCSNCAQDFFSESDSGLRIEPNIVTVPLAPA